MEGLWTQSILRLYYKIDGEENTVVAVGELCLKAMDMSFLLNGLVFRIRRCVTLCVFKAACDLGTLLEESAT